MIHIDQISHADRAKETAKQVATVKRTRIESSIIPGQGCE